MIVAFTTAGESLEATVDRRFGRAPRFLIFNTETDSFRIVGNEQNLNAAQGAGIQSAMNLAAQQVDGVITGNCGPKAYATLDAAGIAVWTCDTIPIHEAIERFRQGRLSKADGASVESHWV